ncbi:hypothetical protein T4A_10565, partial [Trichinella pseudospiralis]
LFLTKLTMDLNVYCGLLVFLALMLLNGCHADEHFCPHFLDSSITGFYEEGRCMVLRKREMAKNPHSMTYLDAWRDCYEAFDNSYIHPFQVAASDFNIEYDIFISENAEYKGFEKVKDVGDLDFVLNGYRIIEIIPARENKSVVSQLKLAYGIDNIKYIDIGVYDDNWMKTNTFGLSLSRDAKFAVQGFSKIPLCLVFPKDLVYLFSLKWNAQDLYDCTAKGKFNRYFCSTQPLRECYVEIGGFEKSCICTPGGDRIPCSKVRCKQGETYVIASDTCENLPPPRIRDVSRNKLLYFYLLTAGIPAACAIIFLTILSGALLVERRITKRTLKVVPIANLEQSVTAFVDDPNLSKVGKTSETTESSKATDTESKKKPPKKSKKTKTPPPENKDTMMGSLKLQTTPEIKPSAKKTPQKPLLKSRFTGKKGSAIQKP